MYPLQETAIFEPKDKFGNPARIATIEASTKSGKTIGSIGWLYEQAALAETPIERYLTAPTVPDGRGKHYWWVAPTYAQTHIAFERLRDMLPRDTYRVWESPPRLRIFNGASIDFKSGERPNSLYGEDVYAAVMDEASRQRAEAWHAVRSTLTATRGPVRLIGNVFGRQNFFYHLARRAEQGLRGVGYYKIVAHDAVAAGVLHAEEIEDARRDLPEHVFKELYLAEPSDDQGNPFGFEHIRACIGPMSTERPVAYGVDIAKSLDWTVIIGIDRHGAVCFFDRFQRPWGATMERIHAVVGRTPALIDSTGVGDVVLEMMQQKLGSNIEGYLFSASSKQKLMEALAVVIQNHETRYPDLPCPIRSELEVFQYSYVGKHREAAAGDLGQGWAGGYVRYEAAPGFHDDTVMSLALAHECRRQNSGLEVWRRLAAQEASHARPH